MDIKDITSIITQLTPMAHKGWEVGESIQVVRGVTSIVYGVVLLALAGTCLYFARIPWRKLRKGGVEYSLYDMAYERQVVLLSLLFAVSLFTGLAGLFDLIDPWTWVSLFDPSLAFSHHLLGMTK